MLPLAHPGASLRRRNIFGDPSLASIRSVQLHSAVQQVRLQAPVASADGLNDFLVEAAGPPKQYAVHSSSGGEVLPVSLPGHQTATGQAG